MASSGLASTEAAQIVVFLMSKPFSVKSLGVAERGVPL